MSFEVSWEAMNNRSPVCWQRHALRFNGSGQVSARNASAVGHVTLSDSSAAVSQGSAGMGGAPIEGPILGA